MIQSVMSPDAASLCCIDRLLREVNGRSAAVIACAALTGSGSTQHAEGAKQREGGERLRYGGRVEGEAECEEVSRSKAAAVGRPFFFISLSSKAKAMARRAGKGDKEEGGSSS